jgi:hypothetical protein
MKLREEKRQIQSNLVGDQSFKIKADAKAFRILSDKLYSNKIKAIIRELSTNAYDSHVDSEQPDRPFIIQLPNNLEPTFAVEDFGTGMDEEKILNLYSTYFDSDKIESNTAVGALGLGSKSPFAYTDTFTVISKHKGTKSIYTCFLNEEEVPSILKIGSEPTREENGLRVEFAVEEKHFHRFEEEAAIVLAPFKVKPIIKGAEIEIKEYPDIIIEGEGWKLLQQRGYSYRYRFFDSIAIQGNIEYPIKIDEVKKDQERLTKKYKVSNEKFNEVLTIFDRNAFVIEFPLGSLGFAPSREHLEYNKFTNDAIFTRCWNVYQELQDKIVETLSSIENVVDLSLKYHQIENYVSIKDSEFLELEIDNKGTTLYDYIAVQEYEYDKDYEVYDYEAYPGFSNEVKCVKLKKRHGYKQNGNFYDFLSSSNNRSNVRVIYHDEQYDDSKKRSGMYRVKQHIRAHEFKAIIIYNKNLLGRLKEKDYELISSYEYLKKPGRKGSNGSSSSTDTDIVYVHKAIIEQQGIKFKSESIEVKDLIQDPEFLKDPHKAFATDFYSRYKCTDINGEDKEIERYEIKERIHWLFGLERYADFQHKIGDEFFRFYTMKRSHLGKSELKELNWNSIQHVFKDRFHKVFANENVKKAIQNMLRLNQYTNIPREIKNIVGIVNKTKLKDYEKRLYYLTSKIDSVQIYEEDQRNIGLPKYEIKGLFYEYDVNFIKGIEKNLSEKLYKLIKKVYNNIIKKRYPMIKVVSLNDIFWIEDFLDKHKKNINSYIELVNK